MPAKKGYWAVRWGDKSRPETLRITGDKVDSAAAACRDCWGVVADNMTATFLTTRKSELQSVKGRQKLLEGL